MAREKIDVIVNAEKEFITPYPELNVRFKVEFNSIINDFYISLYNADTDLLLYSNIRITPDTNLLFGKRLKLGALYFVDKREDKSTKLTIEDYQYLEMQRDLEVEE